MKTKKTQVMLLSVIGLGSILLFTLLAPQMYVYSSIYRNPAPWWGGNGTLRIHRITGRIYEYTYDPTEIDYWVDWWELVGKTSPPEKEEIINYFKLLQEAERNASKKKPVPSLTLTDLIGWTATTLVTSERRKPE